MRPLVDDRVIKIFLRNWFKYMAFWLNLPYKINLRCHTFLSIGEVGGGGGSGCHWREQT